MLQCESAEVYVDAVDVFLRCEIDARPPPSYIYWVIDDVNTTVTDAVPVGVYHVLVLVSF